MVSLTVYSVVIFSHIYLESGCMNLKTFVSLAAQLLIHLNIIIQHRHQSSSFSRASTMLNKVFKHSLLLTFRHSHACAPVLLFVRCMGVPFHPNCPHWKRLSTMYYCKTHLQLHQWSDSPWTNHENNRHDHDSLQNRKFIQKSNYRDSQTVKMMT